MDNANIINNNNNNTGMNQAQCDDGENEKWRVQAAGESTGSEGLQLYYQTAAAASAAGTAGVSCSAVSTTTTTGGLIHNNNNSSSNNNDNMFNSTAIMNPTNGSGDISRSSVYVVPVPAVVGTKQQQQQQQYQFYQQQQQTYLQQQQHQQQQSPFTFGSGSGPLTDAASASTSVTAASAGASGAAAGGWPFFFGRFFPSAENGQQQQQQQQHSNDVVSSSPTSMFQPTTTELTPVTVVSSTNAAGSEDGCEGRGSGQQQQWQLQQQQQSMLQQPQSNDLKRKPVGDQDINTGGGGGGGIGSADGITSSSSKRRANSKRMNGGGSGSGGSSCGGGGINKLTEEFNQLSVEEREKITEEIHGVDVRPDMPTVETHDFIQTKLAELKVEISKLNPRRQRKMYDRAVFLKPSLVDDVPFQLLFLRAARYDPTKAASDIASYFTNKVELFGFSKIVKRITIDDLSPDDLVAFELCGTAVLPQKDSVGRLVVWSNFYDFRAHHWKSTARCYWYQVMTAVQDDTEGQLNGAVRVFYFYPLQQGGTSTTTSTAATTHTEPGEDIRQNKPNNNKNDNSPSPNLLESSFIETATKCGPLLVNLPIRYTGVHMCYRNNQLHPLVNIIHILIGRENRLRFRNHNVSRMESLYALMQFGIPIHVAPVFETTTELREYNQRYLKRRRQIEQTQREQQLSSSSSFSQQKDNDETMTTKNPNQTQVDKPDLTESINSTPTIMAMTTTQTEELIPYPNEYDVLLGRGRPFQDYSGNQYLMQLVGVIRRCYANGNDRHEKRYLAMSVLAQIESKGGRFLKRIDGTCESSAGSSLDEPGVVAIDDDDDDDDNANASAKETTMIVMDDDDDDEDVDIKSNTYEYDNDGTTEGGAGGGADTAAAGGGVGSIKKGWQVVPSNIAIDKILHSFRSKKER